MQQLELVDIRLLFLDVSWERQAIGDWLTDRARIELGNGCAGKFC